MKMKNILILYNQKEHMVIHTNMVVKHHMVVEVREQVAVLPHHMEVLHLSQKSQKLILMKQ